MPGVKWGATNWIYNSLIELNFILLTTFIFNKEFFMEQVSQVELVKELAKKLKSARRNSGEILATFVSAGILDTNSNYTSHYANLKKIEIKKR